MSQQVIVNRELKFQGSSEVKDNITGNPSPEKHVIADEFTWLNTSFWTSTLDGTSDAVAASGGGICGLTMTTGTGDNEVSFLASPLIFDISNEPIIETVIDIDDVSGSVVYFGFSDANTETSPAATIDYADATLAAAATDACGFVIDADKGSSSIYAASIATGGSVTGTDTGLDWTDGQKKTLRIALDTSGNARFYVDGVEKHYEAAAVTDVPLCAIYNWGTRANDGANYVYPRRFKAWINVTA